MTGVSSFLVRVYGIIRMPADDLIITGVFIAVVLIYLLTTMLVVLVPAIFETRRWLKVVLVLLSFFGCLAISLKYAAGYDKFIALALAIIYALIYPVIFYMLRREKRKSEMETERIIKQKQEKRLKELEQEN